MDEEDYLDENGGHEVHDDFKKDDSLFSNVNPFQSHFQRVCDQTNVIIPSHSHKLKKKSTLKFEKYPEELASYCSILDKPGMVQMVVQVVQMVVQVVQMVQMVVQMEVHVVQMVVQVVQMVVHMVVRWYRW